MQPFKLVHSPHSFPKTIANRLRSVKLVIKFDNWIDIDYN
jgi:hypothetical protein